MKVGNHHEYKLDSVLYNYKIIRPNDAQLQNKANSNQNNPNSQQLKPKLKQAYIISQ